MDVILKLIKVCPRALDMQNFSGVTPRKMLNHYKHHLRGQYRNSGDAKMKDSDALKINNIDEQIKNNKESRPTSKIGGNSNSRNVIYITDEFSDSDTSEYERRWNERLSKEMLNECDDNDGVWGATTFHSQKDISESYDDWAARISSEHARKHSSHTIYGHSSSKTSKLKNEHPNVSSSSIPKISQEKRREFEQKMAAGAQQHREAIEARRCIVLTAAKAEYEHRWDRLLSKDSESTLLHYRDVPWPHPDDSQGVNEVADFLFSGMSPGSSEYRGYLRRQRVRWHPDRFRQQCEGRLEAGADKERILSKVTEISKILNGLCRGD